VSKESNPAPRDKHAEDPGRAIEATKSIKSLRRALRTRSRHQIRSAKLSLSRQKIAYLLCESRCKLSTARIAALRSALAAAY
jgi:hypothetical protein